MSKTPKKKHSAEEKVSIVKRHLVGKELVSDICKSIDILPNQFYRWQNLFFENGCAAFEKVNGHESAKIRNLEKKVSSLESRLTHKDNVIAEITEDYVKLKKNSLEL